MSRALWTPHAESELDDILFHISMRDRRPVTGERIYFEIRQLADVCAQPNTVRGIHPDAPGGWFYFQYKRWLVFYQPHEEGIEVMRVVDGSRDLPSVLSKRT
jgi:plasmid stabilization system protein ParE